MNVQRHVVEMVQVPEEPEDELYTFLMEHREWICSMIQADRSGCDDRLFSTSRRVLEPPRLGVDDGGVPEPVHQHLQDGGAHGSHNTDTADTVPPTDTDMGTVNVQQYVNQMERIGGAPGSDTDTVRYIDDTVQTQNSDTDLASQTLQTQDSGVVQAQDTQDTQDN